MKISTQMNSEHQWSKNNLLEMENNNAKINRKFFLFFYVVFQ